MGTSLMAADATACSSRSYEVQLLAGRMEACAEQIDAAQARLLQLQLMDWQSPAGLAYRSSLGKQALALARARDRVLAASLAVRQHSIQVARSSLPAAVGEY
ncbi:hypothetical protein ACFUTU_05810 [Arthrobacter sp. NPDC057388]|jgi:Tfp pilus assembly PilM family ATPase|uniref:hypothetical protein n=1 Tax=Arthrobacter sp. NPDC057388 TaxID=3346116 RepID=UPI003643E704